MPAWLGFRQLDEVARAAVRWPGPSRDAFLAELREREVSDPLPCLPCVGPAFLAFWPKSFFTEERRRCVDPALLDRFPGQ